MATKKKSRSKKDWKYNNKKETHTTCSCGKSFCLKTKKQEMIDHTKLCNVISFYY